MELGKIWLADCFFGRAFRLAQSFFKLVGGVLINPRSSVAVGVQRDRHCGMTETLSHGR